MPKDLWPDVVVVIPPLGGLAGWAGLTFSNVFRACFGMGKPTSQEILPLDLDEFRLQRCGGAVGTSKNGWVACGGQSLHDELRSSP